jgi:hypothetical protein
MFNSKYIIAATDITAQRKPFARFRGKTVKEIYRFGKGVVISRSVTGPAVFALSTIPKELSAGFVKSTIAETGEYFIGYISGVGFFRGLYKCTNIAYVTTTARILYNVMGLAMTLPSKGIGWACDLGVGPFSITNFEKWWFGSPVYIFDDNRLWLETNFTLDNAFKDLTNKKD